jgi:hypothetical protein
MVACTFRRFHRWFAVDSEFHTAQSYGHTVNYTVHTVQYDAYAYDRIIFLVIIRFVRTLVIKNPDGLAPTVVGPTADDMVSVMHV